MDIRGEFKIWLNKVNAKKYSPDICVANLTEVSAYALSKNISKLDLFEITNSRQFNDIRNKLLGNKIFRISNRNTYRTFEKTSKLFTDFLKQYKYCDKTEKSMDSELVPLSVEQSNAETMNIRTVTEAIVEVLKISSPRTSSEIYKEIVARGLYTFGAKAPWGVVFTELMRHCENQKNYSITSKNKLFKIVGECKNFMIFALREGLALANETNGDKNIERSETVVQTSIALNYDHNVGKAFHTWLIEQGKAETTAGKYVSCMRSLVSRYSNEFTLARLEPNAQLGIRRFIELLQNNMLFLSKEASPTQHNRFTSALNAFAEYLGNSDKLETKMCANIPEFYLAVKLTKQEENILSLLKNNFPRGIRLQFIDFMKLKNAYEDTYKLPIPFSDNELADFIKKNAVETEANKFSHIDNLLCNISIEEIENFIEQQNAMGALRIWIEPLFNHFKDKLGDAVNAELLVKIIQAKGKKQYKRDNYYGFFACSEISLPGQREEIRQAVVNVLKQEGTCLTIDELQSKFPFYPSLTTKKGLNLSDNPYIVVLPGGAFAHIDCVYITDDEVKMIKEIIESEIGQDHQIEISLIENKVRQQIPSIFENNETFGVSGIWKAISFRISNYFIFDNWQIRTKEDNT